MPLHLLVRGAQCHHGNVQFHEQLARVLPADLPHRDRLIAVASAHLQLILAANEHMNLTRITSPQEAAVKHVYDCVAPWRHFAGAAHVLDAGTGAGFPGIPLSVVLPGTRFTLAESIGKKARFVDAAAGELALPNVFVVPERAETAALHLNPSLITARAMAPLAKIVDLFRDSLRKRASLLLYKGPDVENEIAAARTASCTAAVIERYELPDNMGTRTLVEIRANPAPGPGR